MHTLSHVDPLSGLIEIVANLPGLDADSFRQDVLDYLLPRFSCSRGAFHFADPKTDSISLENVLGLGLDLDRYKAAYARHYLRLDPFHQRSLRGFQVSCLSDFIPERALPDTELYNEFYKHLGVFHILGISLATSRRSLGSISLVRSRDEPGFTSRERAWAYRVRPVLSAALGTAVELERRAESNWLLEAALEAPEALGLMVIDREWKVVFANEAARRILGTETSGPLCPSLPSALAVACSDEFGSFLIQGTPPSAGASLLLKWRERLCLRVRGRTLSGRFAGEHRRYLQLAIEEVGGESPRVDPERASAFGLTRREVAVASALARGSTNARIASELSISLYTVQTHMQNLFRKVGVHTRTELLSRLL